MIPPAPTGIARFFYIVGILVGFAGIAIMMYAIGTTVADGFRTFGDFNSLDEGTMPVGPDFSLIGRLLPIGLALAIPGSILATVASAIGHHPRSGTDIRVGQGIVHTGEGDVHVRDAFKNSRTVNTYILQVAAGELGTIREIVASLQLPAPVEREIRAYLDEAAWTLQEKHPNVDRAGDRVAKATRLMKQAGAFAKAGGELVPRLAHLASLLGPAGNGILQLLS